MRKIISLTVLLSTAISLNSAVAQGFVQTNTPQNVSIISIDTPTYSLYGENSVVTTFQNNGNSIVTSLAIEYSINQQNPISETISNIKLAPGEIFTHNFSSKWHANAGNHNLSVEVVSVNNKLVAKNMMEKTIYTASASVANFPLFEQFTASTCNPCYTFNDKFNPFLSQHEGQLAIIKYPMDFPGPGDPYYTEDAGTRANYYGVYLVGIPDLHIGGSSVQTIPFDFSIINTAYNDALEKPAFFEIEAYAVINPSNIIAVDIEVTPYISASDIRLHAVVVEKTTTGNIRDKDNIKFHYTMMKMLPDGEGTTFSPTDGEVENFEFSFDLSDTFVEEFNDLSIVVFIQNHSTKEILQAFMNDVYVEGTDLMTTSIDMDKFSLYGEKEIKVTLQNRATETITAFDIEYSIDDSEAIVESVSGIELKVSDYFEYTFNEKWNATVGKHNLNVKVSNVNGLANDIIPSNDELFKTIYIASQAVENTPIFEQFTSSTSNPSADFNEIFNPFLMENINNLSIIKYPLNTPGSGDPYYTEEVKLRASFYNTHFPPTLFVNGLNVPTTAEGFENAFANHSLKDAFIKLNFNSHIDNNQIVTANIAIQPYLNLENVTLFGAVVENETTGNVGNNGETSFKYTLIKMIPNVGGTQFSITDGETQELEVSTSLKNTNVEDLNNLSVIFFVQHDESQEILQSGMAALGSGTNVTATTLQNSTIYPNPNQGEFIIRSKDNLNITSVEIFNMMGSMIYNQRFKGVQDRVMLNINAPKGMYMVKVTYQNGKTTVGKIIVQ